MEMTPVFAYCRVSGDSQAGGDGFERQEGAINAYCAANGLVVKQAYREIVSGTMDSMDRPVWVEMVGAMLANGVRTVVIEKLDRLARMQGIQEYVLMDTQRRGIRVLSAAAEELETEDPTRIAMRQMLGVFAEYDKRMIVLKLRGARQRKKAATGRCEGVKPYGELPGEFETRNAIFNQRDLGYSPARIAANLNREGFKPRRGGLWNPQVVGRILKRVSVGEQS